MLSGRELGTQALGSWNKGGPALAGKLHGELDLDGTLIRSGGVGVHLIAKMDFCPQPGAGHRPCTPTAITSKSGCGDAFKCTDTAISMYEGDTRRLNVALLDYNGEPRGLERVKDIRWYYGRTPGSRPEAMRRLGQGIDVIVADSGIFRILIEPPDTSGRRGRFFHEIDVVESDGAVTTVLQAPMQVVASFTGARVPDVPFYGPGYVWGPQDWY